MKPAISNNNIRIFKALLFSTVLFLVVFTLFFDNFSIPKNLQSKVGFNSRIELSSTDLEALDSYEVEIELENYLFGKFESCIYTSLEHIQRVSIDKYKIQIYNLPKNEIICFLKSRINAPPYLIS